MNECYNSYENYFHKVLNKMKFLTNSYSKSYSVKIIVENKRSTIGKKNNKRNTIFLHSFVYI
jgi:hypothetical protein